MTKLTLLLSALGLAAAPVPIAAQDTPAPELSLEHRMLLRCSAAFALIAYGQDNGNPAAQQFIPMHERGQEFFVRASARVMDETGLDREEVGSALRREAQDLVEHDTLEDVMPVCLDLMDDMGL